MNAIPTSSSPGMSRCEAADRLRPASAVFGLLLLMTGFQSAAQEPTAAAQEPIAAVWREQRLNFLYSSATTVYSCSALAGRVSSILRAVGARDDVKVTVNDCSNSAVPTDIGLNNDRGSVNASIDTSVHTSGAVSDRYYERRIDRLKTMHVYVRLMMPTEVTPEVLTELKKDKSRRELISHATGNPAPRFNDPVLFSAQWQPVTLSSKTIGLEPEECELLDQVASSVFRELGVRVVRKRYSCDPDRVSHIAPELVAEALLPTPYETGSPGQGPLMKSDDDADPSVPAGSDDDASAPAADKPE